MFQIHKFYQHAHLFYVYCRGKNISKKNWNKFGISFEMLREWTEQTEMPNVTTVWTQ